MVGVRARGRHMLSGTPRSGHAALRVQVPRVLQPQPPHPPQNRQDGTAEEGAGETAGGAPGEGGGGANLTWGWETRVQAGRRCSLGMRPCWGHRAPPPPDLLPPPANLPAAGTGSAFGLAVPPRRMFPLTSLLTRMKKPSEGFLREALTDHLARLPHPVNLWQSPVLLQSAPVS